MEKAYKKLCKDLSANDISTKELFELAAVLNVTLTEGSKQTLCAMVREKLMGVEPIQEIRPGLFVSSRIVDGKRLYFGLQNRPEFIDNFRNFAYNVGDSLNPYNLSNAIKFVAVQCKQLSENDCYDKLISNKFFEKANLDSDVKRRDFIHYVRGSGKDWKKIWSIMDISPGAAYATESGRKIFAWISTEPIRDYREFGYADVPYPYVDTDLNTLYKSNRDLVILISAAFKDYDEENKSVNVKGIFKPPHEILYGNHKNIALMFHGFIAHVARTLGKTVYTITDPTKNMEYILNEVFVENKPYRGITMSNNDIIDKGLWAVKTKGLERFFTEADTNLYEVAFQSGDFWTK